MRLAALALLLQLLILKDASVANGNENDNFERQIRILRNIATTAPVGRVLNTTVPLTDKHTVLSCNLRTPDGVELLVTPDLVYPGLRVNANTSRIACNVSMTVSEEMAGDWELYSKETRNNLDREIRQPFTLSIDHAPVTDGSDRERQIRILRSATNKTTLGAVLHATMYLTDKHTVLGCNLRTPDGVELLLTSDLVYPGLRVNAGSSRVACNVSITVSEETIGEWELASTETRNNVDRQIRQQFTIFTDDAPVTDGSGTLEHMITILPKTNNITQLGTTLNATVPLTDKHTVLSCNLRTPDGVELLVTPDLVYPGLRVNAGSSRIACNVSITVSEEMIGDWELYSKETRNNVDRDIHRPFTIAIGDVPVIHPERQIRILPRNNNRTPLKRALVTTVPLTDKHTVLSCNLRTPDGVELLLTSDLVYPGLQVNPGSSRISCNVSITVSEQMIGDWELYSMETRSNVDHEIRQPFTISIEETIRTFPKDALKIESGKNLYVRLSRTITDLKSCTLVPPPGVDARSHYLDPRYESSCGFVVPDVTAADAGNWTIVSDSRSGYIGHVVVAVEGAGHQAILSPIAIKRGEPVKMDVGAEDALFCQLLDPEGTVTFSGFSTCRLQLSAASRQHAGEWTLHVGLPGRLSPFVQTFQLLVEEPEVTHTVEYSEGAASLSCSVQTVGADPVSSSCKFVRPDSAVFIVNEGVGEGRYSYFGNGVSITESGQALVECGLHVSSVMAEDLGTWRCLLESEEQVLSSFLRVSSTASVLEDLTGDDEIAAAAVIEASPAEVVVLTGQEMTISCSVNAQLKYCWFRSQNGTVISVAPGVSIADYEYAGGGFDAGECGLRVRAASTADSGAWTCNVGLRGVPDRSVGVDVTVHATPLLVSQHVYNNDTLVVEGKMYNGSALEYCRFVSPSGVGFHTSSNGISPHYDTSESELSAGLCRLTVSGASSAELGPWTVAASLNATGQEVSTRASAETEPEPQPEPEQESEPTPQPEQEPSPAPEQVPAGGAGATSAQLKLALIILVSAMVLIAAFAASKHLRRLTAARAAQRALSNGLPRTENDLYEKGAPPAYGRAQII